MNDQAEKLRKLMNSSNKENSFSSSVKKNKAKIISISSGKGGVGKTSFAVNFAISLRRLGYDIVIIDADIGLSNIEILSGININYSISDIMFLNKSIFDIIVNGPEGIKIISGGSGFKEFELFKEDNFLKLIEEIEKLQSTVDYIIIDTGAGISEIVVDFVMTTEEVIVICTPDPTSLMDSYILIKSLINNGFSGKINLVPNLVNSRKEGIDIFHKLEKTVKNFLKFKINYLGYIENSNIVRNAIKNQVPFIVSNPNSSVSKRVNIIAMNFIQDNNIIEKHDKETSFAKKILGIFKKRGSWFKLYADTITIGMKIVIETFDNLKKDRRIYYPSQILDILECEEFIIRGPVKNRKLVFLHKNDKINISYNVLDKGKHYFEGKVLSRQHTNMYTLKIKKTSQIINVQNREYYRLSTTIPIIKEFKSNTSNKNIYTEECETKDISGGGMRLYSNFKHEIGDDLVCSFKLLNKSISVKCRIIRIEEVDSFNYKYSLGLVFLKIAENHRDIIIRYIFNQQRKLRLKGLM